MDTLTKSRSLLNPLDRSAEILFGLIMALTFTCSISVATSHKVELRELLISAIGCNIAWGLVDAIMFTVGALARRNRNLVVFNTIRTSKAEDARKMIADELPPVIVSAMEPNALEKIRKGLLELPENMDYALVRLQDIQKAVAIFFLTFLSTFPVVIPFLVIDDSIVALRTSNGVAMLMMFWCGWSVAGYAGLRKWVMSSAMVIIGALMVAITIVLGG